jgi:hypothetical protein
MDGGGTVFESEIAGLSTYVHAPNLGDDDPDPVRSALRRLELLLGSLTAEDAGVLPARWTMVGERYADPNATAWPSAGRPTGDPPCLEFDPSGLEGDLSRLTRLEYYETVPIVFGTETQMMRGRMLLPEEGGCADVQAHVRLMADNDASIPLGESAG